MRNRQRGVTAIGWVVLLTPFAIVGYAGMRLTPVYLNYMKVVRGLDQTARDFKDSGGISGAQQIRNTIDKHFDIDLVQYPTQENIKVTREGQAWVIEAKYEDEAPLFGNLSLHASFDKVSRVGTSSD
jgi:hypothetical protein